MDSISELASKLFENITDEIYCALPCQVMSVNGNYVDVKVFINDNEPDMILYNVPIQRPETQRAYIFMGIKEGDRGVCRFFDRSVEGYLKSDFDYNSDERQHDINDRCFELGFLPNAETFQYLTTAEIEIGLKSGTCKISINEDGTLNIIAPTLTITGDITVNGTLTATSLVAENGASGTFTQSVTSENGIVTGGA